MGVGKSSLFFFLFFFSNAHEILLDSSPNHTAVWIDSQYRGVTPLKLKLKEGRYEVVFQKEGFYRYEESIEVSKNKTRFYVVLNPFLHEVVFKTNVIPDWFYVDGQALKGGRMELSEGSHEVFIFKNGYDFYKGSIEVNGPKTFVFRLIKPKKMGRLRFVTTPPSGVYLGEYYIGSSNKEYWFEANSPIEIHLKTEAKGYGNLHLVTTPINGKIKKLALSLSTEKRRYEIRGVPIGSEIGIFEKGVKIGDFFIRREKEEVELYEKRYLFTIHALGYDRITRLIDMEDLEGGVIDFSSFFRK